MEGVTIIKIVAGIILYSLFFYQMYTAVKRMIDPTYSFVLDQTSFDDLDPKPLITVCKKDQFNVEKVNNKGVVSRNAFELNLVNRIVFPG